MSPAIFPIPPLFLERMSNFLGAEYPAFAEALNAAPQSGLRVNTLKLTPEQFRRGHGRRILQIIQSGQVVGM